MRNTPHRVWQECLRGWSSFYFNLGTKVHYTLWVGPKVHLFPIIFIVFLEANGSEVKSVLCLTAFLHFYLLEPRGWGAPCALPANGLQRLPWCLTASDGLRISPGMKDCVLYLSDLEFTQREALRLLLLHGPSSKSHLRSLFTFSPHLSLDSTYFMVEKWDIERCIAKEIIIEKIKLKKNINLPYLWQFKYKFTLNMCPYT